MPNINVIDVLELKSENERAHALANAEVLYGDPDLISPYLYQMPRLKWCMSLYAGVQDMITGLDPNKGIPPFQLTRFGGLGAHMRDYVIGHIIAIEREFDRMKRCQAEKQWLRNFSNYRVLTNLSIGILGMKTIGNHVAETCNHLGMTVHALVNTPIPLDLQLPYVDQYHFGLESLPDMLSQCDYLFNLLPSTPHTKDCLSKDILSACAKKQSVFINAGRGDVLSENDIIKALDNKWISHAVLDVFKKEPLPYNSELWSRPDVTITFHCAAYASDDELVNEFHRNYLKYEKGQKLERSFDWNTFY